MASEQWLLNDTSVTNNSYFTAVGTSYKLRNVSGVTYNRRTSSPTPYEGAGYYASGTGNEALGRFYTSASAQLTGGTYYVDAYFYLTGYPSADVLAVVVTGDDTNVLYTWVQIGTDGSLSINSYDNVNGPAGWVATAASMVPTGAWFRVQYKTSTNGAAEAKIFKGTNINGTTADATVSKNFGAQYPFSVFGAFEYQAFAVDDTGGGTAILYVDDVKLDTAAYPTRGTTHTGGASLTETGTLTSAATRAASGGASLTGTASATVAATLTRSGDVSLTGTGSLTSDGSLSKTADASLTGSASLTSTATTTQTADASLSVTASLTATGEDTESATGALEATGDLTTDAIVTKSATASLTGTGVITVAGTVPVEVASSLTGTGSLASGAERGANTGTALSSTGALTASASLTRVVDESLAVVADLTALATIVRAASATLTTVAELTTTGLNVRLPVRGTGGAVTNEALLVTSSSESIGRSRGSAE